MAQSRYLLVPAIAMMIAVAACRNPQAAEQAARLAKLEKENQDLRAQLEQKARELAARPPTVQVEAPPAPLPKPAAVRVEESASYQQVRAALQDANRQIADLEAKFEQASGQAAEARSENQRLIASTNDARQRLAAAEQTLDSTQRDARAAYDRISRLEGINKKLREDMEASRGRQSQLARDLGDLEDLDRRRETHLGNILRRYREVSEQYRAVAGSLDSRRPIDAAPARSLDMPRVNEAITAAEEDLRQLRALSVRSAQIQKRLLGK